MSEDIRSHTFPNGLTLVAQPMPWLESAAFTLLCPGGCSQEPEERSGLASLVSEMMLRGCGSRSSRDFTNDLDLLGVHRGEGVGDNYGTFSGGSPAGALPQALAIYADLVRRPHLPEDQLDAGRSVVLQELYAIEDELAQKVFYALRKNHYPAPWGRPPHGTEAGIEASTMEEIVAYHRAFYQPHGSVLAVAGKIDWTKLLDQVESLFGDWTPLPVPPPATLARGPQVEHIPHESNQTHLGVAYDTLPFTHPDFVMASAAVSILSGGMSSRLFTEVREKRGLCYSVFASYHSLRDRASVQCYAGSRPDRAQETLDVLIGELKRLEEGVAADELDRLKAQVKTSLVMQQESCFSRSSSLARDMFYLNRVRTLQEILNQVDAIQVESMNAFLRDHVPQAFTVVTLGPEPLEVRHGIS